MNENYWMVIALMGLWLPACVVMYRMVGVIRSLSGSSTRAREREWKAHIDYTERMIEKVTTHPGAAMTVHRGERIERYRMDTQTEQAAIESEAPTPDSDEAETAPEYATY